MATILSNSMLRRRFIQLACLSGIGGVAGYSVHRGIRFPQLSWEPRSPSNKIVTDFFSIYGIDFIKASSTPNEDFRFRAYAPEPQLTITAKRNTNLQLTLNNIANDCILITEAKNIREHISGINRKLAISIKAGEQVNLQWHLPQLEDYTFASIGDSGGDLELAWCIQRAHELGARFLLHLGDFNYQPGDYQRSIELFNNSPIPCYVSIGNHDFHDDGLVYDKFLQEIGPLNNTFSIGKTRFVNIDTAASMLPYSAGQRGRLFEAIINDTTEYTDTVAFTHRPIYDPMEDRHHDIGSKGERDWLIESLKRAKVKTLISGHIHIYDRGTFNGIENIIAGQGLGHQDLIVNKDYSKILIGQVNQHGKVTYVAEPLAMPMAMHCHPRTDVVKDSLSDAEHYQLIQKLNETCSKIQQ